MPSHRRSAALDCPFLAGKLDLLPSKIRQRDLLPGAQISAKCAWRFYSHSSACFRKSAETAPSRGPWDQSPPSALAPTPTGSQEKAGIQSRNPPRLSAGGTISSRVRQLHQGL